MADMTPPLIKILGFGLVLAVAFVIGYIGTIKNAVNDGKGGYWKPRK